jgi:ribose transport system ATP-binding protein
VRIGDVVIDLELFSPRQAVRRGIVLVPGDRAQSGIIGTLSIVDNVSMPLLGKLYRSWFLNKLAMARTSRKLCEQFEVKTPGPDVPVSALSGGNQQKMVLAKWLQISPTIVLLDEPTQGLTWGRGKWCSATLTTSLPRAPRFCVPARTMNNWPLSAAGSSFSTKVASRRR